MYLNSNEQWKESDGLAVKEMQAKLFYDRCPPGRSYATLSVHLNCWYSWASCWIPSSQPQVCWAASCEVIWCSFMGEANSAVEYVTGDAINPKNEFMECGAVFHSVCLERLSCGISISPEKLHCWKSAQQCLNGFWGINYRFRYGFRTHFNLRPIILNTFQSGFAYFYAFKSTQSDNTGRQNCSLC